MAGKTLRVRFDPPRIPPAVLVAGRVTIPAGGEDDLPAEIAQALLDNPAMNVHLAAPNPPKPGDDNNPKEN